MRYINDTRPNRYYAESDGDRYNKSYYVVDRYGDPGGEDRTIACCSMWDAFSTAFKLNHNWPSLPWDDVQAQLDGYFPSEEMGEVCTECQSACSSDCSCWCHPRDQQENE